MGRMLGLIISSSLLGSIWREAIKSLVLFMAMLVVLSIVITKTLNVILPIFYQTFSDSLFSGAFVLILGVIVAALVSYLGLIFVRDSYFYELVKVELGRKALSGRFSAQLKSMFRVVFLLLASIVSLVFSLFFPILGFVFMSFCLSLELFSYVFDVDEKGLLYSFRYLFSHPIALFVLGAFCLATSFVPGLGLVTYPASIRAASIFYKELS